MDRERLKRLLERYDREEFELLRALSLEVLANRKSLSQISFKQFRDA